MLKILVYIFLTTASILILVNCQPTSDNQQQKTKAKEEGTAKVINVEAFQEKMKIDGAQIVDVRTPEEFAEGTIEGALNINVQGESFGKEITELDQEKPVLLFCRSGKRSAKAGRILKVNGFTEVYDLEGGYLNWSSTKKEGSSGQ